MKAIKEGFENVFTRSVFVILDWKDVQERVCGKSEISVAALKTIAVYTNCGKDNEHIERFWRVLDTFTNEEKSLFLKFVWGRANLPLDISKLEEKFKIYLVNESRLDNHDLYLPQSHTCLFQLDLPRYKTDEACKEKILYAIQTCGVIDTDYNFEGAYYESFVENPDNHGNSDYGPSSDSDSVPEPDSDN